MTKAIWSAAAVVLCSAVMRAAAPDPAAPKIEREIARVEKNLTKLGDQAGAFAPGLERAKGSLVKGRLLFALDELQEPWTFEAAQAWAGAHLTIKSDEQFAAEWKRVGEPKMSGAGTARLPAAVEAIAASNAVRAPATWRASLPYSQDAGMAAGLYYLGEAQAYAAFAAFCRALPFDPAGTAPPFKPMAGEITSLEAEVARLYDKAPADMKSRFIRVSVGLKIARSLDERQDRGAAHYQFLAAKYRAAVATTPNPTVGDVKGRLDSARAHLPYGQDNSIADLFLQRAEVLLESGDAAATKSAAIIADIVLPAYLTLVNR
jgi:hypothetical protein